MSPPNLKINWKGGSQKQENGTFVGEQRETVGLAVHFNQDVMENRQL